MDRIKGKMAKSIRSKWKRKCRAIKRERYGKKELLRLKKTLGLDNEPSTRDTTDTNRQDISNIVTFTTAKGIQENSKDNIMGDMEVDAVKSKFNTRTLRNEHGAYPIWLHPRKIKKTSKKIKKAKKKAKKDF